MFSHFVLCVLICEGVHVLIRIRLFVVDVFPNDVICFVVLRLCHVPICASVRDLYFPCTFCRVPVCVRAHVSPRIIFVVNLYADDVES